MSNNVAIAIKNFSDGGELKFNLSLSSTVLDVKNMIQSTLDSSPPPSSQRLIYGGKVCEDLDSLESLFTRMDTENEEQKMHLLLSKSSTTTATTRSSITTTSAASVESSVESSSSTPAPASAPVLRTPSPAPAAPPAPSPPVSAPAAVLPPTISPPPPQVLPTAVPVISPEMMQQQMQWLQMMQTMHASGVLSDAQLASAWQSHQATVQQQINMSIQLQQMQDQLRQQGNTTLPNNNAPVLVPGLERNTRDNAAAAPVPEAPAAPAAVRNNNNVVVQFIDAKLIFRLGIGVFILGQDLPLNQLCLLIALAIVVYIYLTGIYKLFLNRREAPEAQRNPRRTSVLLYPIDRNGGGLLQDLQYGVAAFILSLMPSWKPVGLNNPAPPQREINNE